MRLLYLFFSICITSIPLLAVTEGLPVFVWHEKWRGWDFINFGDELSGILIQRIVGQNIRVTHKKTLSEPRLFAVGSVLSFAQDGDVVWGAGINGRLLQTKSYRFKNLDIRAVRGPLTREFLRNELSIECPEIYGDPGLLFSRLFPEFKKKENPLYEYLIIPHYSEEFYFPKEEDVHIVYPTEPWYIVIEKILNSKFVISSSLHGLILAESYGIPARMLRITDNESFFKYQDYYLGTGRPHFQTAYSVEQALQMGGEIPYQCDLDQLLNAFPYEFWENL